MNGNGSGYLSTLPSEEPIGVLLLVITGLLLFGAFFAAAREKSPWVWNIFSSAARSMAFVGMVVGGYVFIRGNIRSFETMYQSFSSGNSLSWSKWSRATKTWGGWINQQELIVNHFIEVEALGTLPADDPTAPILYQTQLTRQQIPQNSITGFRGRVDLVSGKQEDPDGFNGFYVQALFAYDVVNQSDSTVETEFLFPLDSYRTTYENVHVQLDEKEITSLLVASDGLHWSTRMAPGQKVVASIGYSARGMEGYTYAVPESREIRNFMLTFYANTIDLYFSVYPMGETIKHSAYTLEGNVFVSRAQIDQAVVAPSIGVSYVQTTLPYAPRDLALHLIRFMPRSSILLAVVFALTLVISGVSFGLREPLSFLSISWAHVLAATWACLLFENPQQALLISAALFTALQFLVLNGMGLSRFARFSALAWTFFFAGIYPLSGQKVETYPSNQYDSLVLAGILIYAFSYALSKRMAGRSSEHKLASSEKRIRWFHWSARIFSIPVILACVAILIYEARGNEFSLLIKDDLISYLGLTCLIVFPLLAWRWEKLGSVLIFLAAFALDIYYYLLIRPSLDEFLLFVLLATGAHYLSATLFFLSWRLKKGQHAVSETDLSQRS